MTTPQPRRILSGVQPSGKLHLGNYFGAIKQHIALQSEGNSFYFLADYHSMTTMQDGALRRQLTQEAALDYLASASIRPRPSSFASRTCRKCANWHGSSARSSTWACSNGPHSYKDKIEKGIEASVGLFTYPMLMAADILIYRSHLVPVGQDQVQHVEMTRDIAEKFNRIYGEVFPLPNHRLEAGRQGSRHRRPEDEQIVRQHHRDLCRGKAAQEDGDGRSSPTRRRSRRQGPRKVHGFRPLQAVRYAGRAKCPGRAYRAGGMGYGEAKTCCSARSTPTSARSATSASNWRPIRHIVEEVLREGAKKARAEAVQTMELVRTAVGFAGRPV